MPTADPIEFELAIEVQDITPEDLDALTRNLLRELRETDVESAKLVSIGTAPKGSKAGESVTIGMHAGHRGPVYRTTGCDYHDTAMD